MNRFMERIERLWPAVGLGFRLLGRPCKPLAEVIYLTLVSHGLIRRQPDHLYEITGRASCELLDQSRLPDSAASGHDGEGAPLLFPQGGEFIKILASSNEFHTRTISYFASARNDKMSAIS